MKENKSNIGWEEKFDKMFVDENMNKSDDNLTAYTGIGNIKKFICETVNEAIGIHNARILNEFQKQGTVEMPLIAYDERLCLIPAVEIATIETLSEFVFPSSDSVEPLTK